jgi:hypothetical protein
MFERACGLYHRLTHARATPGWVLTGVGVGGDVWSHRALTVLSALALLAGIGYHVTLAICAAVKTRHEIREIDRRRRARWNGYATYDQIEGRN